MADTFNPLEGQHPLEQAKLLDAFAITIVGSSPIAAVLSVKTEDGNRQDFLLGQMDAAELAASLQEIADMKPDHPELKAAVKAEMEKVVPFGPAN